MILFSQKIFILLKFYQNRLEAEKIDSHSSFTNFMVGMNFIEKFVDEEIHNKKLPVIVYYTQIQGGIFMTNVNNDKIVDDLDMEAVGKLGSLANKMSKYPKNLLDDIFGTDPVPMSADSVATLEYVMSTRLKERQLMFIRLKYVFGLTLTDIGKMFDLTKERVRQIISRSIDILSTAEIKSFIQLGFNQFIEIRCSAIMNDTKRHYSKVVSDMVKSSNPEDVSYAFENQAELASVSISELNLCNRARNSLANSGIETLYDVMNMSISDCIELKSFGTQCAMDLIYEIERRGYGKLNNFREAYHIWDEVEKR